eukprot:scaffold5667_cov68-Phaeocystis_antarctica.AAC.4
MTTIASPGPSAAVDAAIASAASRAIALVDLGLPEAVSIPRCLRQEHAGEGTPGRLRAPCSVQEVDREPNLITCELRPPHRRRCRRRRRRRRSPSPPPPSPSHAGLRLDFGAVAARLHARHAPAHQPAIPVRPQC